ncbi:MAG: hypothetical protein Q9227_009281 [Pyrenula ochraceoflavens]
MSESLLLPLRVPGAIGRPPKSIRSAIAQINVQKGQFRNVTEESLLTESSSASTLERDVDMDGGSEENSIEDIEDQTERISVGREDMLKHITLARNEVFAALEFVSFVLSKYNPRQAELSLSPEARNNLKPLGTMEASAVVRKGTSQDSKTDVVAVSNGYKTESFRSCSSSLRDAGKRLRNEAEAESKYWEQIMSIKADGWAVSRMPREKEAWGVHFGFAEAEREFRDRGFAALRRHDDGGVYLDFGAHPPYSRSILAIVSANGAQRASKLQTLHDRRLFENESKMQKELLLARNGLFEEELYHEICREARTLTSYGVEIKSEGVEFDIEPGKRVLIRLVDIQDDNSESPANVDQSNRNLPADELAITLRLLLCHAHQENLRRRSQPPPPMTARPKSTPEYPLIRPILAHIHHNRALRSIENLMSSVSYLCSAAQIPIESQATCYSQLPPLSTSPMHTWLGNLISEPLTTTISLSLPTSKKLDLRLRTHISLPIFGTEMSVVPPWPKYDFTPSRAPPRLTNLSDIENFLLRVLNNDILSWIESRDWYAGASHKESNDSMELDTADQMTNVGDYTQWKVFDHLEGRLRLIDRVAFNASSRLNMRFGLGPDSLKFTMADSGKLGISTATYVWAGSPESGMPNCRLRRVQGKNGSLGSSETIALASFQEIVQRLMSDGIRV